MSAERETSRFRWYHFRLWFLVVVVPLGGMALGWPWSQLQRLETERRFEQTLSRFDDVPLPDTRRLVSDIIRRRLPLVNLPNPRHRLRIRNGNTMYVPVRNATGSDAYLFHLSDKLEIIGAISLTGRWQAGRAPELPPYIRKFRDFVADNQTEMNDMTVAQIRRLLHANGYPGAVTIPTGPGGLYLHLNSDYRFTIHKTFGSWKRRASGKPGDRVKWLIYPPLHGMARPRVVFSQPSRCAGWSWQVPTFEE